MAIPILRVIPRMMPLFRFDRYRIMEEVYSMTTQLLLLESICLVPVIPILRSAMKLLCGGDGRNEDC